MSQSATRTKEMDRTIRSISLADSFFGCISSAARNCASTLSVFQSDRASSWSVLIFFASARMSPRLTPNCLSPAPLLAFSARTLASPSDFSCFSDSFSVMAVLLAGALFPLGHLDEIPTGVVEHGRRHRPHVHRRLGKAHACADQPVVFRVHVLHAKRRERNPVLD